MNNNHCKTIIITKKLLSHSFLQAFAKLIDRGRILLENTDVKPYVVDGINYLAEQSHGLRKWYYWGPTYGSQAQPDLAKFVRGQPSG